MDAMQKPTHYTTTESGFWEPWPFGYLNTNDITTHIKDLVDLTKLPIYAVKFKDDTIFEMPIESTSFLTSEDVESLKNAIRPGKVIEIDATTLPEYPIKKIIKKKLGDSLNEAHSIINGERQDSYGNPEDSFSLIAQYWNAYFSEGNMDLKKLTALDVAHMMMLFKLARCSGQQSKRDNYIDIQGYAAIAADRLVKE
ncbi:MAG TPA: DUF6378 domain-containing protein [Dehalococcoidia bacterium]|nr:DUF6378 domain-containing protein [Dehalococcoidia bacterium]